MDHEAAGSSLSGAGGRGMPSGRHCIGSRIVSRPIYSDLPCQWTVSDVLFQTKGKLPLV